MGEAAPPMLAARAIPRRRALIMGESLGRLRRMGCDHQVRYVGGSGEWGKGREVTYLDDGEAEDGRSDITDPHAGEHGDEHARQQDVSGLGAGFAKDKGGHHFRDVVFG